MFVTDKLSGQVLMIADAKSAILRSPSSGENFHGELGKFEESHVLHGRMNDHLIETLAD